MPRGRGHRAALEEIGTELNLVPYMDMITVLVLSMMMSIVSFLSFTMLDASIPTVAPDADKVIKEKQKEQLLLMVRVTSSGYLVDPNVQGGAPMGKVVIPKTKDGYNFARLTESMIAIKNRFKEETRVLVIAEPKIIYDNIILTMDALREKEAGKSDLFPDVTLSIF